MRPQRKKQALRDGKACLNAILWRVEYVATMGAAICASKFLAGMAHLPFVYVVFLFNGGTPDKIQTVRG
jgi:hypothetical protein